MAKAYVFSTLSTDMNYSFYAAGGGDLPIKERDIYVKGGSGVANDRLITPFGVVTEIEEEDIPRLEAHPVFKMHQANGFVMIERKKADPEKVATNMTARDQSAPLTDADFADDKKDGVKVKR